jgi:subtilisin family serine protease
MKDRTTAILRGILFLGAGIIILLAAGLSSQGLAADPTWNKVEPLLVDEFSTEGQADFIISFTEQADLSPASSMGWKERGEFVYNALKEVAGQSQAAAKDYLSKRGLTFTTFIAGNELYVSAGDQVSAIALAEMPEVGYIRATRTYHIDPLMGTSSMAGIRWAGDLLANQTLTTVTYAPDALAWGIAYTHANQFWSSFGIQGNGIKVANIDTGVQWNHPALDQAFACPGDPSNPACWSDPSNICGAGGACDNNGHGTHTMGTMVGDDDPALTWQAGMAPGSTWIACKGCESNNCSDFALNTCADWILAPGGNPVNRPNVVNNSWGGGGGDTWYLSKVNAWRASGIFPAFSAGNSYTCGSIGSPGDYQESFASAAVDSAGSIAAFSSKGPSSFGHDPYTKPNIAAPGVSVCSSIPNNGWSCGYSGTSMASPHTAGAVALLWSCNPSLVGQVDLTFQALQNSAGISPAGKCGAPPDGEGNYTFGYGYLDAYALGLANCGQAQTGELTGRVTIANTSTPIANATVTATPGSASTTTDANGDYSLTLTPGTYAVTASAVGYNSQTATGVVVTAGGTTIQNFALTPQTGCTSNCLRVTAIAMSAPLKSTNATVTVKNENGVAVSKAVVFVHWDYPSGTVDQNTRTNGGGNAAFRLSVTTTGTYTITVTNVTKAGYTFDPANSFLQESISR